MRSLNQGVLVPGQPVPRQPHEVTSTLGLPASGNTLWPHGSISRSFPITVLEPAQSSQLRAASSEQPAQSSQTQGVNPEFPWR